MRSPDRRPPAKTQRRWGGPAAGVPLFGRSHPPRREQPPDVLHGDVRLIGLLEHRAVFAQLSRHIGCLRQGPGEQHVEPGTVGAHPMRQSESVHRSRHLDVAEHDLYADIGPHQDEDCFIRAGGFDHLVSALAQIGRDHRSDKNLVVNQENSLLERRRRHLCGVRRQGRAPSRSASRLRLDRQAAPSGPSGLRKSD